MLESLILGSHNPYRRGILPDNVKTKISFFRHELLELEDDPGHITSVLQYAGELARLGQYGYVDQVNEQYIKYNQDSSPNAIPYSKVQKLVSEWIPMIKRDFFDKAIANKDIEEAKAAIEEMEDMSMWAKLTDQYDTEEFVEQTKDYLEVMYEQVSKLKSEIAV